VELTPPLLLPDDTPLDGAWSPLFDELLLDPSDELLDEPVDPVDPLEPVDPVELVPEFDVEPVDELELDEDLLLVLVAAWLVPGSITATTPATATLARDTVVVVAFSRRRPCSRSATPLATCRAASRSVPPRACSFRLFTLTSVTRPAVSAVAELSVNVLSAAGAEYGRPGVACARETASI
jgi:hypothetical protein